MLIVLSCVTVACLSTACSLSAVMSNKIRTNAARCQARSSDEYELCACAWCASRLLRQAQDMDLGRWSTCGCCREMTYDDGEDRMWWWDGEAWTKLICYECNDMLGNVRAAQVCLQKLFRTSQIFSLENVARHIGECLAQYWDIRRIQHLRLRETRFWQGHLRFRNWSLEKNWRPDQKKGEYV